MLLEVARTSARQFGPVSIETIDDALSWFEEIQKESQGERRPLLWCYLRDVKHGSTYAYADYFKDLALRAIRAWRITEGVNPIRIGRYSPVCAGANEVSYKTAYEWPICGSLKSVVAMMFAIKMQNQCKTYGIHDATERAIGVNRINYPMKRPGKLLRTCDMGAVYYNGSLIVTSDQEKLDSLVVMASSCCPQ